jgi:hypothetical protein
LSGHFWAKSLQSDIRDDNNDFENSNPYVVQCVNCMNAPNLVVLLGARLTDQNYFRCGIQQLSSVFNVTTFDCTPHLNRLAVSESIGSHSKNTEQRDWGNVIRIVDFEDFVVHFDQIRPIFVLDFAGPNRKVSEIQRHVQRNGAQFVVHELGKLPMGSFLNRLKSLIRNSDEMIDESFRNDAKNKNSNELRQPHTISVAINILRLIVDLARSQKADIALIAGRKPVRREVRRARSKIYCNSLDSYSYKLSESVPKSRIIDLVDGQYHLFADEALVHSEFYKLLNWNRPVNPDTYFVQLNEYFSYVEQKTGKNVVIAGPPHCEQNGEYRSSFSSRKIFFGETAELIRNCDTVFVHGSTSVSIAVLARKPIKFLVTNELRRTTQGYFIVALSRRLRSKLVSIDKFSKEELITKNYNIRCYEKYIADFLEADSSNNFHPWNVFIETIQKNNDRLY